MYYFLCALSFLASIFIGFVVNAADCAVSWRGGTIAHFFAEPFNVFNNNTSLLTASCHQDRYTFSIGDGSDNLYIYKDAYLTEDGDTFTQRIELSGTKRAGDWIIGKASADVPYFTSSAAQNYIAFYGCMRVDGVYKCGCSGSARECSVPSRGIFRWFLGGFRTQQARSVRTTTQHVNQQTQQTRQQRDVASTETTTHNASDTTDATTDTINTDTNTNTHGGDNATAQDSATPTQSTSTSTVVTQGSSYAVSVKLPSCSGSKTLIIDSVNDWQKINDPAYTNFCVKPGDYRGAGVITLTSSGSAQEPRVIQLFSDDNTHPAKLPEGQQALLGGMRLGNGSAAARYWVIDRMSFVGLRKNGMVGINEGSSDNILNRIVMRNNMTGIDLQNGAHRNVIQNSYIGDMTEEAIRADIVCIGLQSYQGGAVIADTRIVGNELVNCNDAIQFIRNGSNPSGSFPGTLVADNDIYVTAERLTDCNGTVNGTGPCMIGENAIDAKGGSDDASKPVQIIDNRMWNIRRSDPARKPGGSWGDAIVVQYNTQNMVIKNNIIMDSNRGIVIHLGSHNTVTEGNTLFNIGGQTAGSGYGIIITTEAGSGNVVRHNTIIAADKPLGDDAGGNTVTGNTIGGVSDITRQCFMVKRISGPEEMCIPH